MDIFNLEVRLVHRPLALPGEVTQHRVQALPDLAVQELAPALGDPDSRDVVLPPGVGYAFAVVNGTPLGIS